jgi:hypothetical protein
MTKTALLIALAEGLRQRGQSPHIWTCEPNHRQTRLLYKPSSQSGLSEKSFILSQSFPTWIGRHPENAVSAAAQGGATLLLLDEKASNVSASPHFSIFLWDENTQEDKTFSDKVLHSLSSSEAVVCVKFEKETGLLFPHGYTPFYTTFWSLHSSEIPLETPLIGFTGLLSSGIFYQALLTSNYNVRGFVPLPTSKRQKESQFLALLKIAQAQNALLVTSQQDFFFLPKKFKSKVHVFSLKLVIDSLLFGKILSLCAADFVKEDVWPVEEKKASGAF